MTRERTHIDRSQVRKILIVKLRAVGDVLLSTIVTKNLRLAFPDARIDFLIEPPGYDILHGNPYVDQICVFDKKRMNGLGLIRSVRNQKYDLILDLFGNPRTALVTYLSGARYRVGYRFRHRTYAYNLVVEPRGGQVHNTQFNLDSLEAIGVEIADRSLYFRFTDSDAKYVDEFMAAAGLASGLLVCLNPGGGWYTKRWGLDRFAALADAVIKRFHANVVLPWGPGQRDDVETIQGMMKHTAFIPPETTLPQLGALLSRCSIVVSNDSGPMHIAAAVGTPVLGIFGPTSPRLQGPYGTKHLTISNEKLECLGCNFTRCPIGIPCMLELDVETVLQSAENLLRKNNLI